MPKIVPAQVCFRTKEKQAFEKLLTVKPVKKAGSSADMQRTLQDITTKPDPPLGVPPDWKFKALVF